MPPELISFPLTTMPQLPNSHLPHTVRAERPAASTGFQIVLFCEKGVPAEHAAQLVSVFERHPGPVTVSVVRKPVVLKTVEPDNSFPWSDAFQIMQDLRQEENLPSDAFLFLLTVSPNENNWYAVEDPDAMRNGFGHVGDFSWVTSAPSHLVTAHYLRKAIFNVLVDDAGIDWETLWHESPRGCFYDFCQQKTDLAFKLRTADICGDCMEVFQTIGVPDRLLTQTVAIMETTRRAAVNTGQYQPAEPDFRDWPFPVAITRHKAVQTTNPLLRFMLLLDHFDSLVRYFYLAHEIVGGRQPEMEDRPSLGWWVDRLAKSLKGEKNFRQVVAIAQEHKVVSLRNERRGHGWMAASEDSYREDAERLERILGLIEQELKPFLDKYRLVVPRQIQLKNSGFVVEGDALTGSHVLHPNFSVTLADDPRTLGLNEQNKVYLTDARMERFHLMSPYISHVFCPECKHPRVLITDGGDQFIDVFMGHRVNIKFC